MRAARLLLIGIVAVLAIAVGPSAYASHHKRKLPKSPKYHYKPDQNAYLFGGKYKTPKKQNLPKSSHYKH